MRESGVDFNPETAQDLRPKGFDIVTCGERFSYTLQIPGIHRRQTRFQKSSTACMTTCATTRPGWSQTQSAVVT